MSEEKKSEESPEKAWLQLLLSGAREDVEEALEGALAGRNFASVYRIVKLAEEIASADGRPEFRAVCQRIVAECEFDKSTKHLFTALVAHLANGDVAVYDKFRRLQSTHAQVEAGRQAVEVARSHVDQERSALEFERKSLQQLKSAYELSTGAVNLPDLPALPAMSEIVGDAGTKDEGEAGSDD